MDILIVDDEQVMVDSLRIGLESRGYRVVTALTVRQALDRLCRPDEKIDLVLADFLMPGENGLALLEGIRRMRPALPVIIMSGYLENGLAKDTIEKHGNGFLEKPFSLVQLIAEIERLSPQLSGNSRGEDLDAAEIPAGR